MGTNERETRYAEALIGVQWHRVTADVAARAVMAVADEEQGELRAEVARLRAVIGSIGQGYHSDTCRIHYAPQGQSCNCFQAELRAILNEHAAEGGTSGSDRNA